MGDVPDSVFVTPRFFAEHPGRGGAASPPRIEGLWCVFGQLKLPATDGKRVHPC
jgi:hypothetical protein